MELEQWLREHPPEAHGLKAHATELQKLKALGYTQEQMRAWLSSQGLTVSRQAISKFFLRKSATAAQPLRTPDATAEQQPCNKPKNPSAAPPTEPAAKQTTLKERAQAVGDRYLQQTLSPLATQLLNTASNRKT